MEDETECRGGRSVPLQTHSPNSELHLETWSGVGTRKRKKIDKKTATSSQLNVGLSLTCAYCTFKTGHNRQNDMKRHLLRLHPEMFFKSEINSSHSSWKNEQFRSILMEIVLPKFIVMNEEATATDWCSCSVCGKECLKYKRCLQLKVHLIDNHINEVRENLKDVMKQSDASLKEKIDNTRKPSISSKEAKFICEFCNKSFPKSYSVRRHMKYNCKKKADEDVTARSAMMMDTGRKNGNDEIECNEKKPVALELESEAERENEEVKIIEEKKRSKRTRSSTKTVKTLSLSPSTPPKKRDKKLKTTPTSPKISASPPSTSSKNRDKPFCDFCNKTFTRLFDARRHWKYACPKREKIPTRTSRSRLTCAYCSHECASRPDDMKRHLVRCHPEMFFNSERNNSSSWKQQHFKNIVTKIAIPNFISRIESFASCSLCRKKYTDKSFKNNCYELTRHLIDNHIEEVREYLQDILEESDASLQEKLENVRTQSISSTKCEFCSKSFISSSFAEKHRKYYCMKGERRPLPMPTSGSALTCAYCSHKCANRSDYMRRHLVRCHLEMFFESERKSSLSHWKDEHFETLVKEIAIPKFIVRDGTFASCKICCKKYSDKTSYKNNRFEVIKHLIQNHIQKVREHLKDILGQSDSYLQEQLIGKDNDAEVQNCKSNLSESDEEDENNDEMDDNSFMDVECR